MMYKPEPKKHIVMKSKTKIKIMHVMKKKKTRIVKENYLIILMVSTYVK